MKDKRMVIINPYLSIDMGEFTSFEVSPMEGTPGTWSLNGLYWDGWVCIAEGSEEEMLVQHKQLLAALGHTFMDTNLKNRAKRA